MEKLTEEDIQFSWNTWGETKPWYCHECDTFLAADVYFSCDGTDAEMPKNLWKPHKVVPAQKVVTFDQFKEITLRQNNQ